MALMDDLLAAKDFQQKLSKLDENEICTYLLELALNCNLFAEEVTIRQQELQPWFEKYRFDLEALDKRIADTKEQIKELSNKEIIEVLTSESPDEDGIPGLENINTKPDTKKLLLYILEFFTKAFTNLSGTMQIQLQMQRSARIIRKGDDLNFDTIAASFYEFRLKERDRIVEVCKGASEDKKEKRDKGNRLRV